jgi:hypothetical protein
MKVFFFFYILRYFPKIIGLNGTKDFKKRDPMQLFAEKGDFSNKKRPKRDPVGSSDIKQR